MIITKNEDKYLHTRVVQVIVKGLTEDITVSFEATCRNSAHARVYCESLGVSSRIGGQYAHANSTHAPTIIGEVNEILDILGVNKIRVGGQLFDAIYDCYTKCDSLYGEDTRDYWLYNASAIIVFKGE